MDELRDLAELRERQDRQRNELETASAELRGAQAKLSSFVVAQCEASTVVGRYLLALPERPEGEGWWTEVYLPEAGEEDGPASLDQLLAVVDRVFATDQTTRTQLERRAALVVERDDLLARQRHVDQRKQARQRIIDDDDAARGSIAAFDAADARLIADAEQERLDILRDSPIRTTYDAFLVSAPI
ncbi:hypothetical protein AB4120_14015 [Cupriavidus sp. 2KB_3]|uniref:hypothetical protein n=1 Tax=Cupriavidus sp. 2KB_3 TaxID=3232980 RepID=UPI003F936131